MGDYFDKRTGINFLITTKKQRTLYRTSNKHGITMDLTLGNHDLYYKNTSEVNSCDAF